MDKCFPIFSAAIISVSAETVLLNMEVGPSVDPAISQYDWLSDYSCTAPVNTEIQTSLYPGLALVFSKAGVALMWLSLVQFHSFLVKVARSQSYQLHQTNRWNMHHVSCAQCWQLLLQCRENILRLMSLWSLY